MRKKINFSNISGFEWDSGNKKKSVLKHNVKNSESEEIFSNKPVIAYDKSHSQTEDRYLAYGLTNKQRMLVIAFTLRNLKIRVISSRNQDKKEREFYEKNKKNTKI